MTSGNPLNFPNMKKSFSLIKKTGLNEALVVSRGKIMGHEAVVAIMDARFRMGSMAQPLKTR